MKARRGKRRRDKWREAPTLIAILDYEGAKSAFDKLVLDGVPREALGILLQNVAVLERPRSGDQPLTPEGIPIHTIRRLPKRIEEMASTIDRVEAHNYWTMQRGLMAPDDENTKHEMARLPELLRKYAFRLSVLARANPAILTRITKTIPFVFRIQLVETVETLTGSPHYDLVATLLTAALFADGRENTIVTPESLRALRKRQSASEKASLPSAKA